jgi:YgiT-type zinc finger domain-containing protein
MKDRPTSYDYGECQTCGERMEERQIKQDFWIKGKLIVIEDVPAGVCPRCGERWSGRMSDNGSLFSLRIPNEGAGREA